MRARDEVSPFLRKVREAIRVRHYSIRTEEAYVQWVKRFIVFHGKRHPSELGEAEVATFLTHLAVVGNVASSTQNQALNALVFLYGKVLSRPLAECVGIVRAKRSQRLPTVLTQTEVGRIRDIGLCQLQRLPRCALCQGTYLGCGATPCIHLHLTQRGARDL